MRLVRLLSIILFIASIACTGCRLLISRDEVSRVSSPDDHLDAVLFETNGGAPTSFGYDVVVGQKGSHKGTLAAKLYGATRNAQAYGVNLRWSGNNELVIEYLNVESPPVVHESVDVEGRHVQILLRSGITDLNAPSGGMLYNLKQK